MSPLNLTDKPSYQPWSEESFQSNRAARRLATLPRWMYRTLCQAAFHCETRPYLPDDDAQLWELAECESREQWDAHKAPVRAMFTPIVLDGKNLLSHKRITDDWDKLLTKRQAMRELGSK